MAVILSWERWVNALRRYQNQNALFCLEFDKELYGNSDAGIGYLTSNIAPMFFRFDDIVYFWPQMDTRLSWEISESSAC